MTALIIYAAGFVIFPLLCLWHDRAYLPRTDCDSDSVLSYREPSLGLGIFVHFMIGLLWPLFVSFLLIFYTQRFFTERRKDDLGNS